MDRGIIGETLELFSDQVSRYGLGAIHVTGVLHGEAGKNRQGMAAKGGDGLDVGLNAGAAGRIKAGKNQNLWSGVAFDDSAPQNGLTTARITTARRISTGSSLNHR